ncbi:BAHD acyltransferase DCR [Platanthera guangdongensis]|uniref:BAHD acyltransferase DCR n=1 Tax=Platanthera guangdongensis TaxID=2320717 RepID=A0ABR2M925_9ASPA
MKTANPKSFMSWLRQPNLSIALSSRIGQRNFDLEEERSSAIERGARAPPCPLDPPLPPEAITIFAVFADCRLRIQPSIPNSYFGNLIQAVFTDTVVDALLTAPPQFASELL